MKNMENKLLVIENKELITKLPAASQKYIIAKYTEKIVDLTTGKAI
jgi:adenylate kinase